MQGLHLPDFNHRYIVLTNRFQANVQLIRYAFCVAPVIVPEFLLSLGLLASEPPV